MPLDPAEQVKPIYEVEIGVAARLVGDVGSASFAAETTADIGETLPPGFGRVFDRADQAIYRN